MAKRTINKLEVGNRIKNIRQSLGFTMKELGEKVGKPYASDSIVSRWERGISIPNNARLKRIAELGNTTVEELLYGEGTSVKDYITSTLKQDESFPMDDPAHRDALSDTIACFEDCDLPLEDMDIATVLLSNVDYHKGENGFRIHDRKSYIDFLGRRIQAFETLLGKEDITEIDAYVFRISMKVDKETLRELQV